MKAKAATKTATKPKQLQAAAKIPINSGVELQEGTVGELISILSGFPATAKLLLNNLNAFEGNLTQGMAEVFARNATIDSKNRVVTMHDDGDGPVNAAVIGFWNEGYLKEVLGPKLQAEMDAA